MSPEAPSSGGLVARPFAKVNLGLEVLAKRSDGYHELRTLLQTVDFHDVLRFRPRSSGIEVTTNMEALGTGPDNLVYRAAALLGGEERGVSIRLEKNVPLGMGLGGGSADAALTLLALDRMWELRTPASELHRLASSLGMDVPFFLYGGTALALGRGNEIYPVGLELDWPIVLILPDFSVSTASAYASLILTKRPPDLTLQHFVWRGPSIRDGLSELVNHLEGATGEHFTRIQEYKRKLLELGARVSMMSGSGSAVFGIFRDESAARLAAGSLKRDGIRAAATRMLTRADYRRRGLTSESRA